MTLDLSSISLLLLLIFIVIRVIEVIFWSEEINPKNLDEVDEGADDLR